MTEEFIRLTKDLKVAAMTMTANEARYLVDTYYQMQENRKRAENQVRALSADEEPHATIAWLSKNARWLENQIKRALDVYGDASPLGRWAKSQIGIGPVISAGLLAHINLEAAPTVGHIWNFAGLSPDVKWFSAVEATAIVKEVVGEARKITPEHVATCALKVNRKVASLEKGREFLKRQSQQKGWTRDVLKSVLSLRPWNARLKTLCWKIGESFVKVKGKPDAYYGILYIERRALEDERSAKGEFKKQAEEGAKRVGKSTEAYKAYSKGFLPAGHLYARAKRYAVKRFLAHYHEMGYKLVLGKSPPNPYPLGIQGHTGYEAPPNQNFESRDDDEANTAISAG